MSTGKTAIIAGSGGLPALLAAGLDAVGVPFVIAQLDGYAMDNPAGWPVEPFVVERLALLFDRLDDLGVERVVFAGAVQRPAIDPERIDPRTAALLPRLLPAFQAGDDALLRAVIGLFEDAGFAVVGAADLIPSLTASAGVIGAVEPSDQDAADAARASEIVAHMGPLDVGQGAVVARGLCLAIETLPGTAAMIEFVRAARTRFPAPEGREGVLFKAPKPTQDLRVDMPAIGPDTITAAQAAGLSGIAIAAGGVMIIDRARTIELADAAGIALWAVAP
jgi:DUF1009 family protein